MDKNMIKDKLYKSILKSKDDIKKIGDEIYKTPETGFKEYITQKIVLKEFEKLGLKCQQLENIPGVKATIDTGKEGPSIALIGELDAVLCSQHPDSNNETGAVHACGHNIMIADIIGAAKGILDSGICDELVGKIHFIAVPAEEYLEMDFRSDLIKKGIIKYPTGKVELLHRGFFNDVDICVMIHAMPGNYKIGLESGSNGFIAKKIRYIGKAAHAASAPHNGINALYAANIGIMAVNSIRETFKEESCLRIHPIMTRGGDAVNVIPSDVHIETFIRGSNIHDVVEVNKKVNRALVGGAVAVGAKVEIEDTPGMFPFVVDKELTSIAKNVGLSLVHEEEITTFSPSKGSTDLGDISSVMPAIETCIGCLDGGLHSPDYKINDYDTAYVLGTKFLAGMAVELLYENGRQAKTIINEYIPIFKSKMEYFQYVDKLFSKNIFPKVDYMK
ncbi:amidohydrolase [Haloimpatiens sp. FM7330]|uniref:amidohydrolase n=1 Tax=Haloimpatiens sp. FM7330 TaxID=3298610 RepID=UPI003632E4D1